MARIGGVNIANHQHAEIALTAVYGIGRSRARLICTAAGIKNTSKIKDLSDMEMDKLREQVARFTIEGDLRREVSMNIKRLMDLGTWRGFLQITRTTPLRRMTLQLRQTFLTEARTFMIASSKIR